jgi:hypothetical protein
LVLFIGKAKLYASRSTLDQASLNEVVILNRATRLSHDVDYALPIGIPEPAPDLSLTLAERDGVDALHLDEEHPDQVLHCSTS